MLASFFDTAHARVFSAHLPHRAGNTSVRRPTSISLIMSTTQCNPLAMTTFECDPRDLSTLLTCDCPCAAGRYSAGNRNVGKKMGRMHTFPRHSFPITEQQIDYIAGLGLFWSYVNRPYGALSCVGCKFKLKLWTPDMDVRGKHDERCPECPYWTARMLGYATEIDVVYGRDMVSCNSPWRKPVDHTRFVCDPKDYYIVWPREDERYKKDEPNNVGYNNGRCNTFPPLSIDFSDDICDLADSGFIWSLENEGQPRGTLTCIGCRVKINNWTPGANADEAHRDISPDCPWLRMRDAGHDMEKEIYWDEEAGRFVVPALFE